MAKNLFGALIAGGIVAMLMFQVFVNVGMTIGIMPITGVPLPLMSYGGSSVIVTFLALGLLQSIHVQAPDRNASASGRVRALSHVSMRRTSNVKKQVLVSVDRGETRVALLEATGNPPPPKPRHTAPQRQRGQTRPPATASPSSTWSAAAAARSSATSTRARSTTSSPASRPRSSTSASRRTASCTSTRSCCPASRRRAAAAARRQGAGKITDLLKPGQEIVVQVVKDPLKTKGARLSMELRSPAATWSTRRRARASASRAGSTTRSATACARRPRSSTCRAAARSSARPRRAPSAPTSSASCKYLYKLHEVLQQARRGDAGAGDGLPGGRPLGARRARHLLRRTSSARSSTTRSSTTG